MMSPSLLTTYHYQMMTALMRGAAGTPLQWNDSKEFGEMRARTDGTSDWFTPEKYPADYWTQLDEHRKLISVLAAKGLKLWSATSHGQLAEFPALSVSLVGKSWWMKNDAIAACWIFKRTTWSAAAVDLSALAPTGATTCRLTWLDPWHVDGKELLSETKTIAELTAVDYWTGKMEKVLGKRFGETSKEDVLLIIEKIE